MRLLLKLAIAFAIAWGAHHWWAGSGGFEGLMAEATPKKRGGGFVDVLPPDGFPPRAVVIMAPEDCPSDAAQRAESLYAKLQQAGVRVEKRSSFELSASPGSGPEVRAQFDATIRLANSAVPVVFIGKSGASNPDFEAVLAEYRRLVPRKR